MEDGYIKFKAKWEKSPALPLRFIKNLNHWRNILYNLNLIGAYENGIGFGNISQRFSNSDHFIISGSGTGIFDLDCRGPIMASSESMSHGVIYRECRDIQGVIHIHNKPLWEKLMHKVPTTDNTAAYGTPEMAHEIMRLIKDSDLMEKKILVMEGHEEGIFTFGKTLEEAGEILLDYYQHISYLERPGPPNQQLI
jgi:ribulose-5-phosphate 4-epimerase/fuculose-1-phosphate aldolase